jgi:hypothetical protein
VTPRDKFGNYLGPGYAPAVKARLRSDGAISEVAADPRQLGDYVFLVRGVPERQTPAVDVTVQGVEIGSK